MEAKCSNGGRERAFSTSTKSHGGTEGGRGGCYPSEKSDHQRMLPNRLPLNPGMKQDNISHISVDGRLPLSNLCCRKRITSDTGQLAGSISFSQHQFTNTPHLRADKRLVDGARDSTLTEPDSVIELWTLLEIVNHGNLGFNRLLFVANPLVLSSAADAFDPVRDADPPEKPKTRADTRKRSQRDSRLETRELQEFSDSSSDMEYYVPQCLTRREPVPRVLNTARPVIELEDDPEREHENDLKAEHVHENDSDPEEVDRNSEPEPVDEECDPEVAPEETSEAGSESEEEVSEVQEDRRQPNYEPRPKRTTLMEPDSVIELWTLLEIVNHGNLLFNRLLFVANPLVLSSAADAFDPVHKLGVRASPLPIHPWGASQYPSSFPRSSVLHPMTRKPIELSHLEGHLNSLIAPRGGEDRGVRKLPEES
ncbi:hypothetical protein DPX16_22934 [Anabarilius grahami]|uniref:Uncharacterized protein n=1 Tax=Anabarilius grahami TaxID=495550 RepID=A0A3N0YFU9_ANAGA|nr:hypothetical protein DPX16_22934 [Anabarilius grahami]